MEHNESGASLPIRDVQDLASATECTGLIPAAVEDENEAQRYAELYAIHRQKVDDEPRWDEQ